MTSPPLSARELEAAALSDVSVDRGWRLIERFADLVRESGSEDERKAAAYITGRLDELGVPYEVHEPELYLSLPRNAWVQGPDGSRYRGKPPAFSRPTAPEGLTEEAVHVPASPAEGEAGDLFGDRYGDDLPDVEGKVVVTEGYGLPLAVGRFEEAGAAAQIHINPGERIHWGICTSIWGTPTDEDLGDRPSTPVVSVNRPDGERLLESLERGRSEVTLFSDLDEGWYTCPLPVARIDGRSDDFLLAHGHYDSWDVGIGDNAVGDATLLELARIFHARRDELERSLRVAWWPAHSTGRYAGSTWYADRFALDLAKRCVATMDIDSPGCWKATSYDGVPWMAECGDLCRSVIREVTGEEAEGRRPPRAGDYSFGQIGVTSFFMLLSSIPDEERERLGFYPVGGCGGNIAWHTEDDRMDVADRDHLERDLRVYAAAVARVLNADVLPFDYRATVAQLDDGLRAYEEAAGEGVLAPARRELEALREEMGRLYDRLEGELAPEQRARANRTLKSIARKLVPLAYGERGRFAHDPALPRPDLPPLADAADVPRYRDRAPERLPFLETGLRRKANRVGNALWETAEEIRSFRAASTG